MSAPFLSTLIIGGAVGVVIGFVIGFEIGKLTELTRFRLDELRKVEGEEQ